MNAILKKTPKDATEFEREQLRFLLTSGDFVGTLTELNPSLAWLPILAEMKLIKADTQLAPWIEKNFAETDAVREVAANIRFFGPDTANILEFRLNRMEGLPALLMKSWRLIVRHMRSNERGKLRSEWFDIEPRVRRGEHSPELLMRIADALTPKLEVGKRLAWYSREGLRKPERPSDLMSINYEIEDGVTENEVLAAWPESTPPEADDELIRLLTQALSVAVLDAIEVGVESSRGYGVTDSDVPSVAEHRQNAHRSGFQTITRVLAEVWTRLAQKDATRALLILEIWQASALRLLRRLALFAAADPHVPGPTGAAILLSVPQDQLFLSTVETYRLAGARWRDFPAGRQKDIERRIAEGPPADSFRDGSEIGRLIDRARFDFLEYLQRNGIKLGAKSRRILRDIHKRYPEWEPRPQEQAGFHVWHGGARHIVGDAGKLAGVPDENLVAKAKEASDDKDFLEGSAWDALCQSDAPRALRGLAKEAEAGRWAAWAWRPFLWAANKIEEPESVQCIAQLLLKTPGAVFAEISSVASWWLEEKANTIKDGLLWPLWDRIEAVAPREEDVSQIKDALQASMNAPPGHLAAVLIKKIEKGAGTREVPQAMRARLDKLVEAKGIFGRLARVRLAAEVSFLFERIPDWTKERIVPLFDWTSPEASDVWDARKYSNYIGSPELIGLTKKAFLALFRRSDSSDDDLRTYSEWLAAIMVANHAHHAGYPITALEARAALRQAGDGSLSSVGHRLAIELERAKPEEKLASWRNVVGPVFQSIWPLDVELQSSSANFKLVQILRASGEAFPEAVEVILPFIRPENARQHTSVFSISEASDALYTSAPEKMLDLLAAVVGDAAPRSSYGLGKALDRLRSIAPHLADTKKFQKLAGIASAH